MVEVNQVALDRVFRALASEPRREILRRAARERCTVTGLAEHFDNMTLAAVSKHVRVLDEAGLLSCEQDGRLQWRSFNPKPLRAAQASISELQEFWSKNLDALGRFLQEKDDESPRRKKASSSKARAKRR